jgi:hypothetical protein
MNIGEINAGLIDRPARIIPGIVLKVVFDSGFRAGDRCNRGLPALCSLRLQRRALRCKKGVQ